MGADGERYAELIKMKFEGKNLSAEELKEYQRYQDAYGKKFQRLEGKFQEIMLADKTKIDNLYKGNLFGEVIKKEK